MALAFIYNVRNRWPFSIPKYDDLKVSNQLVKKLPVPEYTKQFVFAVQEPESKAVIYILSAQNLSEQSALDAQCLIREVRPDAVVAQVGLAGLSEILSEEIEFRDDVDDPVPTSTFRVLKRCFVEKINREKYESVAGNLVLRDIFGVSFHGHFLAAKKAAEEVGSSFLMLESSLANSSMSNSPSSELNMGDKFEGLVNGLVPLKVGSVVSSSSKRFCLHSDVQSKMVKLLTPHMDLQELKLSHLSSDSVVPSKLRCNYEVPRFAQSIYPLLVDLHDIFGDLPRLGSALGHAQKMLFDVAKGEPVDAQLLYEMYGFRIAVEGLRIALNNAARLPMNKIGNPDSAKIEFSALPVKEKSYALLAQSLRSQTKKFKTIVAVVDANCLVGLRRHWNTSVPLEVKDLVEQLVTNSDGDGEVSSHADRKGRLTNKPVVAVGAGATAVLGVSSFSKLVPASTVMKVVTYKVPASLKIILSQGQKVIAFTLTKVLGPSKVIAPGIASSGAKTSSVLKAAASAEKIRAVAHSIIASAEKTSISAMRTAFYEIMRKRRVRPIGFLPWATFGCSIATCSGLLLYGDGIECATESLPAAHSIASLGRGIRSFHQASEAARQADNSLVQRSIESLMSRMKKIKPQ